MYYIICEIYNRAWNKPHKVAKRKDTKCSCPTPGYFSGIKDIWMGWVLENEDGLWWVDATLLCHCPAANLSG